MGTQQILMIVLSVIIVGIAVGVGITMFQNQAKNSNRQAVIADLNNFAAMAEAFYKVPASMGGGGNGNPGFQNSNHELSYYLGFSSSDTTSNGNGEYKLSGFGQHTVTITGTGTEIGNDDSNKLSANIVLTADGTTGKITKALTQTN